MADDFESLQRLKMKHQIFTFQICAIFWPHRLTFMVLFLENFKIKHRILEILCKNINNMSQALAATKTTIEQKSQCWSHSYEVK